MTRMRRALPYCFWIWARKSLSAVLSVVAGQHFGGEWKTLGRDDEGDDDLHAVAALVPAGAEAARAGGIDGRITFKIRAGQIVKKHPERRGEEVAPARGEVLEERRLVGHGRVVAFAEAMNLRARKISAEPVREGRVRKPMPVPPPRRTRINEPVEPGRLQDLIPARAPATGG